MKKALINIAQTMHRVDPETGFTFEFWDGETVGFGDSPRVKISFKCKACARRILANGFLGFGESYMNGDLEIEGELQEILRLGISIGYNDAGFSFRQKLRLLMHAIINRATSRRAPKNIACHYDLGNTFYALYLDKTMTYSCAYFNRMDQPLEQAQLDKYDHIARKLLLKPGESLLDIGCGWGGMLIHAAQNFGINGVGITLSKYQFQYARRKLQELGLEDRLEIRYQDYRDLSGKFDKIVSIGMFEHVGKAYIPIFIQKVKDLLNTGGLGLLHTIGKDSASPVDSWVVKYIFPGGYIPSLDEMVCAMGYCGFSILDVENLRMHYAQTLDLWAEKFECNVEKVRAMFDEAFVRRWRLFLHSSAAGFKYGNTRLFQILFSNGLRNDLPITRAHVYRR